MLEGLAASRGYTLEGLAEETRRRGHDFTPEEIATGARSGFGVPIDDALRLDEEERGRVAQALSDDMNARINLRRAGGIPSREPGPSSPVAPGVCRYPGENPREDGRPRCCVSHPHAGGPCGEPAVGEVWSLPFCDVHHAEAEAAALNEMWEEAYDETTRALGAARPSWRRNAALLSVLRDAQIDAQLRAEEHSSNHEGAAEAAYGDADDADTDRNTLVFDYSDLSSGTPLDWYGEERRAALRAMREAQESGLILAENLEPLREWATVQEILAVRREVHRSPA